MAIPKFKMKKTPEPKGLRNAIADSVMRLATSYAHMQETLIRAARDLGYSVSEMVLEEHDGLVPQYSRRSVLYVTRNGQREKFGEVACLYEESCFRLRMHIETEKQDA